MVKLSERARYRVVSSALVLAQASLFAGVPGWICLLIVLPLWLPLPIITYRRLRSSAFSGEWVWRPSFWLGSLP